ncbi:hypothetical protein BSL82_05660 [Tardibacter chloracetimidivorans]|uniref:Bacteriophage tail tape measure N-terminal domain-containing protein n=1 Tax=Tardibacter chloracetimidivorans TaxID=1921510 RepID=A0A1L3ZTE2_9SPHN|nr:phage tail length tape measure family protein [Tardibacter chloracetimidivorans]API58859.1 hypothetical protein BSL82_05660 [Tardibacter chloracetimidivorans]
MTTAASLHTSLVLESSSFVVPLRNAVTETERGSRRINDSLRRVDRAAAQSQQRMRLMGYQISDIGAQLAGGQSPFLILAQQAPQMANAMDGAKGAVGRLAAFFSGPWGAALLAAGSVTAVLASKLWDSKDATDAHSTASMTLTDVLKNLDAIMEKNAVTLKTRHVENIDAAQAQILYAESALKAAEAELALAQARRQSALEGAVGGRSANLGGFGAVDAADVAVARAEEQIAKVRGAIAGSRLQLDTQIRVHNRKVDDDLKRTDEQLSKRESAAARRAKAERERAEREALKDYAFQASLDGQRAGAVADTIERLSETKLTDVYGGDLFQKMADDAQRAIGEFTEATGRRFDELNKSAESFNQGLSDGLADALVDGKSLGDVLVNSFKRAAAEALSSGIFNLIGGANGSSGVGGFLASTFGGFFADGGTLGAGKWGIAGERGPELIKGPASIIPAHALKAMNDNYGGGNVTVMQTIAPNFAGNAATREEVAQMAVYARQSAIAGVKEAQARRGPWRS